MAVQIKLTSAVKTGLFQHTLISTQNTDGKKCFSDNLGRKHFGTLQSFSRTGIATGKVDFHI